MKSYRFNTIVETDGSVHLSGLPPQQEVEIVVVERTGLTEEMLDWLNDIRDRHPFAKMSKAEILETLSQTREIVNSNESRLEYRREDFGTMDRGKYAKRMSESPTPEPLPDRPAPRAGE